MIAERAGVDMDNAFTMLRLFARSSNRMLTEVAESIVAGTVGIESLVDRGRPSPSASKTATQPD